MRQRLSSLKRLRRKLETRLKHFSNHCLKKVGLSCFFCAFCVLSQSFAGVPAKKYPIIITQEQRVGILEDRIAELEQENQAIHPLEIEVAKARTEAAIVNRSNRNLRVILLTESTLWIAVLVFLVCV